MNPRASKPRRGGFHLGPAAGFQEGSATPSDRSDTGRHQASAPARLIAFNKPYGVICQFTREGNHPALADFINLPGVYPAGRLDTDSEGLLLLTNHGPLQNRISSPKYKLAKTYWAQVEGEPEEAAINRLCAPLDLGDFVTAPASARRIDAPDALWPRDPPIRVRAAIPTSWLAITLTEGKNRQVRRMTAKAGFPTLRLIRAAIGPVRIEGLRPGQWRDVDLTEIGYSR